MRAPIGAKQKANAVFEGGGVKGIGIAGALTVASRYYEWAYVAGTSCGAIIAALVAAGYTAEEIKAKVFDLNYRMLEDPDFLGQIPVIGPILSLDKNLGLYRGDYIENWVRDNLKQKGVQRFGDLALPGHTGKRPSRCRLRVIASDISRGEMLTLPQDIARYGIDPDYLDVARAVRMSISIPFFFHPVKLTCFGQDGSKSVSYIVDGGVLSNFPVWLFDGSEGVENSPTFGFRLAGPHEGRPNEIKGPISMLKALFTTMMEAHDNRYIEEKNFSRTITIPNIGVRSTDFGITARESQALFQAGIDAAEEFFARWDYRRYVSKYAVKPMNRN